MKLSHLDKLTSVSAISGDELTAAQAIIQKIENYARWELDPLGNLIVYKEGVSRREKPCLVMTHIDEAGFIISGITDEGYLRFQATGDIDNRFLLGRRVLINEKICGVIGSKAIHQTSRDERKKPMGAEKLLIDIGASSKAQAEENVSIGDGAVFLTDFERLGGKRIKGKALGDRIGCAVMISLIRSELQFDTTFVFMTRHHAGGCEGTVINRFHPAKVIRIDTAKADDTPGGKKETSLGKGVILPFAEQRTVFERDLYRHTVSTAKENGIPIQQPVLESSDSRRIMHAGEGVPTVLLAVPCRYLNGPAVVADEEDIEQAEKLVAIMINE